MQTSTISMLVSANQPGTALTITLNDTVIYTGDPATLTTEVSHEFPDADGTAYRLVFAMSGKTPDHTKISESGEILQDLLVNIRNIKLDNIEISQLVYDNAVYRHDFNGTADPVEDKFYSDMGCNGTVTLDFTAPVYLWLLENM